MTSDAAAAAAVDADVTPLDTAMDAELDTEQDLYALLRVERNALNGEIRTAYKELGNNMGGHTCACKHYTSSPHNML